MLAKEKLNQLKNKYKINDNEQKVIDAFKLELIDSVEIENDEIPGYALINLIYQQGDIKIYQSNRNEDPYFYYSRKYGETPTRELIKTYKFKIVEDFDEYYDEIK